jgi:hypothetical protein
VSEELEVRTHESVRSIGEEAWSRLAGTSLPFMSYRWFDALEQTGCVGERAGWLPLYVTLHREEALLAVVPAFVKTHSQGEFVFDHAWARFAEMQLGLQYYPKLVAAVPFTPATGDRLLTGSELDPAASARMMASALTAVAERLDLSSAHILFSSEREARALADAGLLLRYGIQYHWRNRGYASFDDFLSSFNAKRRHQLRRERRAVRDAGIEIRVLRGRDLTPEVVDFAYRFYCSTVDKFYWGQRYLNRAFFETVCTELRDSIQVVLAEEQRIPIAGAFNLLGERALFGRYWGAVQERPFLHFNVCYYQGIEFCIQNGLDVFEPGAGGEHKLARGFLPTITYSTHAVRDARLRFALNDFCERERAAIEEHVASAAADANRPR